MNKKLFSKVCSMMLAVLMCFNSLQITAFATETETESEIEQVSEVSGTEAEQDSEVAVINETEVEQIAETTNAVVNDGKVFGLNGYYNILSSKKYDVVPGAVIEKEMVINNASGNRRQVMHIMEIDPSNPDISILPGYYGIDKDLSKVENHSAAGVTKLVEYYEDVLGYNVVGAMNTGLAYDSNAPYSFLVYNGEVLVDDVKGINDFHSGACETMLCVYKNDDGTCYVELRERSQGLRGDEWQAIGANFSMVVKDGKLVSSTESRSSAAARSMVGVKEDGTLVLVMNDGRGANNSIGFSDFEEGEAMLALGCQWAFNCDGGGSSTFVTKRAGEDKATMRSVPCDGAERPTLNSVVIVSNVAPTGELGEVEIVSEYDYFAPNTSYTFGAEAIDTHGYAMDIPEGVTWQLSDSSLGTITNGKFVSNGTTGDVNIEVVYQGNVVGSKKVTVTNPQTLKLSATTTVIPYTTAEKVRTIELPIVALVGEANVYYDESTFNISLSNEKAGTMDGFKFTATSDTSVAGVKITLTYVPNSTNLTYDITFGKGSEVIWNFEDKTVSGFLGQTAAIKWQADQGIEKPLDSIITAGNMSDDVYSESFVATRENGGQVHNGEASLGIKFDLRYVNFNSWVYANIYNVSNTDGSGVLRDVANGKNAIALGAWVYIPEGFYTEKNAGALAIRGDFVAGASAEKAVRTNFNATYNGKTINSLTENDIPENRWIYITFNLSGYNYVSINNALSTANYSPCFARMYVKPSEAQILTYYFDDFTLDYSSAVDDRNPPVISEVTYCTADTNIEMAGQTITTNVVSFNAKIADFTASNAEGLDYNTAKVYLDGVALNNVKASGTNISVDNVELSNGEHKVTFEIADKAGNATKVSKTIIVDCETAKSEVTISGHNDSNEAPLAGSVYYVDLVADTIEDIDSVEATIELQTAHTWILDQMIPAKGFEVSYTVNNSENEFVTITVTKTGNSDLTGENTLVSIPVRVWSWDENWVGSGTAAKQTTAAAYAAQGEPVLLVEAHITSSVINYNDGAKGSFGGDLVVATKIDGAKTSGVWHTHDTELTVLNKEATIEEAGYENRTYCETCKSVIDWGTTLAQLSHNYEIVDGKFVCQDEGCGHVYESGTGIFEMNGKLYYSINDALQTGWQTAEEGYCYANPKTYEIATGKTTLSGITYSFDENGILEHGEWVETEFGKRYSYGPGYYRRTWLEMDGANYYFDGDGYMYTGIRFVKDSPDTPAYWYDFGTDGATDKEKAPEDGLYEVDGEKYIVVDGVTQSGLYLIDGDYYYGGTGSGFDKFWCVARNQTITISSSKTNGLVNPGVYEFDDEGKMVIYEGPVNGRFYKNGNQQLAYQVVEHNGYYYFIGDGNKIVVNKEVYVSASKLEGTPFSAGYYKFGADGRMVVNHGPNEDGYFYINGVKQKAYQLIAFGGDYYFIGDYNKYIVNKRLYVSADKLEGTGYSAGYYEFDADGKMIINNGPNSDGYFYINGVKQLAYQLIEFKGDYYFIGDYNKYVVSKKMYVSSTRLEGTGYSAGYYEFDSTGKMIINNGPNSDGYFYINGVKQLAYQLIEFEGDYYFISDGHKYITNKKVYVSSARLAGTGLTAGYYEFDSTGKMIINNGPNSDGYFYINGVKQLAYQLIEFEGDYYFISDGHKYITNKKVYVSSARLAGTGLSAGYYEFDSTGKMIIE